METPKAADRTHQHAKGVRLPVFNGNPKWASPRNEKPGKVWDPAGLFALLTNRLSSDVVRYICRLLSIPRNATLSNTRVPRARALRIRPKSLAVRVFNLVICSSAAVQDFGSRLLSASSPAPQALGVAEPVSSTRRAAGNCRRRRLTQTPLQRGLSRLPDSLRAQ